MRIIDLQRRLREVGRIRIGEQVPTGTEGKTRPVKLEHFRFTSRDRQVIEAAASVYGGEAAAWGEQWEVKTTAIELPVVIPPSDMAFSQAYEQWKASGCKVRCDGNWDHISDKECHCDPAARACDIHTRLSVILPDLPGLGVWRLDTQGYYAAVELGGVVDLCASYAAQGTMLPARLRLEQREAKRFKADGSPITLKFAVPVLDVDVHPLELTGRPMLTPVPQSTEGAPSIAEQVAALPEPKAKRKNAQAALPPSGLEPRVVSPRACALCGEPLVGDALPTAEGIAHAECAERAS